jgi:Cell wall-associated hydrolases (invasion-associated proteins)
MELSKRFLELPYTWGGRSSFGYDCSGFVQMLYRQMGIFIPRDAIDQMHWEKFTPIPIEEAQLGDLYFLGPS